MFSLLNTVALVSQKGGSGKTTLGAAPAVAHERAAATAEHSWHGNREQRGLALRRGFGPVRLRR